MGFPGRSILAVLAILGLLAVPGAVVLGDSGPPPVESRNENLSLQLGTAFTYQGRLSEGGGSVSGVFDFRFILYDQEVGGSQVGATVTKTGVAVAGGLFSVQLDFGAAVFTGEARWVEVSVRESAGGAVYSIMSPRQPITAVPYALFARTAALALPFAGAGSDITANGLLSVTQSDSGIALVGRRTYTGDLFRAAVYGVNAGAGAGVEGESSATNGAGVRGLATGSGGKGLDALALGPSGTAARLTALAGTALELAGGAIRTSGVNPPVFQHVVRLTGDSPNSCGTNGTVLDSPFLNDNPTALVIITHVAAGGPDANPAGARLITVAYNPSNTCAAGTNRWVVFAAGASLAEGERFNILVVVR